MIKVGLWQFDNKSLHRLNESSIGLEVYLEDWIEKDPSLVQSGLEIVGRQINIKGGRLDLLAIDPQGRWVIIEIKRDILRRDIIAQVLDYASSLYELSDIDLRNKVDKYLESHNKKLDDILEHRDAFDSLNPENRDFVFFVIGTGKQPGLERISNYLSQQFNFPISIITFQIFETSDGKKILAREVTESEVKLTETKKKTVTVENVISLAQGIGVGAIFNKLLSVSSKLGFYPRAYKSSIMFTPPTNKSRMLFTIWAKSKEGRIKAYVGPSAFAEFYPISDDDVIKFLGPDGWRYMNEVEIDKFVNQLQNMFSIISEHEDK